MSTYRTGNHWGTTIVREGAGPRPCDQVSLHYCFALGENARHDDGDELVAQVVDADRPREERQLLAERVAELLTAAETACDCGHAGLPLMFHLRPCPVAALRDAARNRLSATETAETAMPEGHRAPPGRHARIQGLRHPPLSFRPPRPIVESGGRSGRRKQWATEGHAHPTAGPLPLLADVRGQERRRRHTAGTGHLVQRQDLHHVRRRDRQRPGSSRSLHSIQVVAGQ